MLTDPSIIKTEMAKHIGVNRVTLNASLERKREALWITPSSSSYWPNTILTSL